MKSTPYFDDFQRYFAKAESLERKQHFNAELAIFNDELILNVPIYNNVHRRFAGFSKVPEYMWPQGYDFTLEQWHYLFLVHRVTGSGASFEHDHGFRNSIVRELAEECYLNPFYEKAEELLRRWYAEKRPIFTSIGNQIPPFNKPSRGFPTGGIEYLIFDAPEVIKNYLVDVEMQAAIKGPISVCEAVDHALAAHGEMGFKKFHFVLTAFAMDTAEYFPNLVNPASECYYGKNAFECFELLFENNERLKKQDFYRECMQTLWNTFPQCNPMDLEDVCCDYIRYVENYVPPHWMKGRMPHELVNNSFIQHPKLHPKWVEFCTTHRFDTTKKQYL
tara:strand:+ start:919 stop:1917 length:999 start_codon:yes stop_codon:yes gene_type:complete